MAVGELRPGQGAPPRRQVQVETKRVHAQRRTRGRLPGPQVVVGVEDRDEVEDRLGERDEACVAALRDDVRVADVEANADRVGVAAQHEAPEAQGVGRDRLRPRVERCQVLDGDRHFEPLRAQGQALERAGLAAEVVLRSGLVGERERVVDDERGAGGGRVLEQRLERDLVVRREQPHSRRGVDRGPQARCGEGVGRARGRAHRERFDRSARRSAASRSASTRNPPPRRTSRGERRATIRAGR